MKTGFTVIALLSVLILGFIGLGDALVPLLLSFGLAYLLFPVIKKLEAKGVKRSLAVTTVFTLTVVSLSIGSFLIVPSLIIDAKDFLDDLPDSSMRAIEKVEQISTDFGYEIDLSTQGITDLVSEHAATISSGLLKSFSLAAKGVFSNIIGLILMILNIILVPLFFFYVINDYEKISEEVKSFIPRTLLPKLQVYSDKCNVILSGYIRGQMLVALILALLYGIGLSIVGVKFGFLIGIITGLISIIPYAGFFLGFMAAIIVTLANFTGMGTILGISIVFIIVQTLEGFLITPKLVGNKVGLSSFATMLALIIGGNLLGLFGMLLAIPMAAILKSIISELKIEYQSSKLYE
jgi:predicted PurR-regulated permease PerM